eukprot:TRINITY_DN1024_c1_g1_i1.p1 TRINITY_DN1024_c1_g1~~TRINITY_DN1024_c1_g1_i1.p1  ORF type:complete len:396 (+),score=159.02 TRINITY_DN1024_c1_g1_i1:57-1244(+)
MPKHAKTSRKFKKRAQPYEPPIRKGPVAPSLLYGDDEGDEDHIALGGPDTSRERAVIYLGRIPYGFFENEMHGFFSQFGEIVNLRLARNKKTGKSKHYAFIEFEEPVVADVVAEAMNNYLLFGRILKCKRLREDQIHPFLFRGGNKIFSRAFTLERHRAEHNKPVDQVRYQRIVSRRLKNDEKKKKKLAKMGIEYEYPGIEHMAMRKPSHTKFVYSDDEEDSDGAAYEDRETFASGDILDFSDDEEEEDYEESDGEEESDDEEESDEDAEDMEEFADVSLGELSGSDSEEEDASDEEAEEESEDDFEVPWSKPAAKASASPATPKASTEKKAAAKSAAVRKGSASARKPPKPTTPAAANLKRPATNPRDTGFRVKRNKAYKGQGDPTPIRKRRRS